MYSNVTLSKESQPVPTKVSLILKSVAVRQVRLLLHFSFNGVDEIEKVF